MTDFIIKRNDRKEAIERTLKGSDGVAIDLTGATVKFIMRAVGGAVKVDAAATIVNAASGIVRYSWAAADTDTAGSFEAEWEILFGDGTKQTAPNDRYLLISIYADIG